MDRCSRFGALILPFYFHREQSFSLKYPADSWRFYISKFDYLVEILIACQADPADKSGERDRTENALRKKTCWDDH